MYKIVNKSLFSSIIIMIGGIIEPLHSSVMNDFEPFTVRNVSEGVYAGEGVTYAVPQPVYFGMEKIDDSNRDFLKAEGAYLGNQTPCTLVTYLKHRPTTGRFHFGGPEQHSDFWFGFGIAEESDEIFALKPISVEVYANDLTILMLHGFTAAAMKGKKKYMSVPTPIYNRIKPYLGSIGAQKSTDSGKWPLIDVDSLASFYQYPKNVINSSTNEPFFCPISRMRYTLAANEDAPFCPFSRTGFSTPEINYSWTDGPQATIRIPVLQGTHNIESISFETIAWVTENRSQNVHVRVNNGKAYTYHYDCNSQNQLIQVPITHPVYDFANITFSFPDAFSPASIGKGTDQRRLGVGISNIFISHSRSIFNPKQTQMLPNTGFYMHEKTHVWSGEHASLKLPLIHDGLRVKSVSFNTSAFVRSNHPQQNVSVSVNGKLVDKVVYDIKNPEKKLHIALPIDNSDHATIAFHTPTVKSPAQLKFNSDKRQLGVAFKHAEVSCFKAMHHLGNPTFSYYMEGFSGGEGTHRWTNGNVAILDIPLSSNTIDRPNLISFFNTKAYVKNGHSQSVKVKLNGHEVRELKYDRTNNNQKIDIVIPQTLEGPIARIMFELPDAISPGSSDSRKLGLSIHEMLISYPAMTKAANVEEVIPNGFSLKQEELHNIKALHHIGKWRFPYYVENLSKPENTHTWTNGYFAVFEVPLMQNSLERPNIISFLNTSAYVPGTHSQTVRVKLNGEVIHDLKYCREDNHKRIDLAIPQHFTGTFARIHFELPDAIIPEKHEIRRLGLCFKELAELSCIQNTYYLGNPAYPYHLEGCSGGEGSHRWTDGNLAVIEVPLSQKPSICPTIVTFLNTKAYVTDTHSQTVRVKLQDKLVRELRYDRADNNKRIDVMIPQNLSDSVARIVFELPDAISPGKSDSRKLGLSMSDMLVFSPFRL